MLDEGVINDSDKNLLLKALAKSMSKDIKDDMDLLKGKYSKIDKFSSNPADFLQQRPSSLISFLSGLTGIEDVARVERKKSYSLCLAVEQIYFINNSNFIGPLSFSHGLVTWSFSGSKAA